MEKNLMLSENDAVQVSSNNPVESKQDKHLITDIHFQQLTRVRDEVFQATQVKPSVRKLLCLIIEKTDLAAIREQLIKQYS